MDMTEGMMKRMDGMTARIAVASIALGIGCGGVDPGPQNAASQGEALAWELVARQYPYRTAHGDVQALVCADWEKLSAQGDPVDVKREWYPIDTMNRHLAHVGTPQAVAHVDEEFRTALLERGVSRIETCEDARAYVALNAERLELAPLAELEAAGLAKRDGLMAKDIPTSEEDLVEKILNGGAYDHPSTVAIRTTSGQCSGNLISRNAMVTAAHCVPGTGIFAITAWINVAGEARRCITHPGLACPSQLGADNVLIQVHPNYDGGPDFDQAVIINGNGWREPANTPVRWTRFAANWGMPFMVWFEGHPVHIAGYGHNTVNGA
jgi:hypothetical protein